jgi:hypothetical protein
VDAGRAFGSFQADELKSHTHGVPDANQNAGFGSNTFDTGGSPIVQYVQTTATGGAETRPRNRALLACVKF